MHGTAAVTENMPPNCPKSELDRDSEAWSGSSLASWSQLGTDSEFDRDNDHTDHHRTVTVRVRLGVGLDTGTPSLSHGAQASLSSRRYFCSV